MTTDRLLHLTLLAMSNIGAMVLMIILTSVSHSVRKPQKHYFQLIFSSVIVMVLTQYLSRLLENAGTSLGWAYILVTVLSFLLTPLLPVIFSSVISGYRRARPLLPGYCLYAVLVLLSIPFPIIFTIDASGTYARAGGYWIYIAACFVSTVYLIREIWRICTIYQHLSRFTVVLLLGFLLSGTSVELFMPGVFTGCSCLSFSSILCYLYFTEQWLQQDGLTGLLNHSTYLRRMEDIPLGSTLILFDVNRFKEVNDSCGHLFGDLCLREIANLIRSVFQGVGYCYRIGGDEFAVLVQKKGFNPEEKCAKFLHFLHEQRQANPKVPGVALGIAVYREGMTVEDLINEADRNMYLDKSAMHQK